MSEAMRFGVSTLERWFYVAKSADNAVEALARKVPKHAGTQPSIGEPLRRAIELLYRQHPSWTFQLHHDNLVVLAGKDTTLGPVPSYGTLVRFMRAEGLLRQKKRKRRAEDATTESPRAPREMRSFASTCTGSGISISTRARARSSCRAATGESRYCSASSTTGRVSAATFSGTSQKPPRRSLTASARRSRSGALCRSLLTDNGAAMLAAETTEGLARLGIIHYTTLPYTPEQNAKQEVFWAQIEGRLLPMLERRALRIARALPRTLPRLRSYRPLRATRLPSGLVRQVSNSFSSLHGQPIAPGS
jgi:putative transposase